MIIFSPSGRIHYQYNSKVTPFNDLIASIVNETYTEVETNFVTTSSNQKRFYGLKRDALYAAIYYDVVTTIDSDKIRQSLSDILKTYVRVTEDLDDSEKVRSLVEYQFEQLMKFKISEKSKPLTSVEGTPVINVHSATNSGTSTPTKKKMASKKKMRKWENGELVEVSANDLTLDYSESKEGSVGPSEDDGERVKVDHSAFSKQNDLVLVKELNEILGDDNDDDDDDDGDETTKPSSGFFSKIGSYFGSSVNIDDASKKFKDQLIAKNIAASTATTIIDRIKNKLGSKLSVTLSVYRQTLVEELTKILTPNVSTDLLYDIKRDAGTKKRPFVISVVGVNGVGKSTNLAKLAYWFLQNDLNVLICACDTFRSGAVEQLKVHVNNLQRLSHAAESKSKIDLFEKGYGGGDHVVATAKAAIQHASTEGFDIVLIDTAGRTHSNAKLMAPLKKFGDAANPDKIIMVGEALVGTDSVEQAINFNNAFGNRRSLDFFIISKVDTVGDLVGAMINMVMATKVPILFVGTGQTYTDIKRLSIKRVVDMLMS